jgi:hypothetical protein
MEITKLDLSDLRLPRNLADILRRVYQHEACPAVLRTFIRFEMGKYLGGRYDMREFLNSKEYEPE